jgi:hypothetical protein
LIRELSLHEGTAGQQLLENTVRFLSGEVVILITQERDEEHSSIFSGLSQYATKSTDDLLLEVQRHSSFAS